MAAAGLAMAAAAAVLVVRGGPSVPVPAAAVAPASAPLAQRFLFGRAAGATLTRPGASPRALSSGESWSAGDRLHTADGPVELSAADGTSLSVAANSELLLLRGDAERWLRLASGAVSVHVAKLKTGERFVVLTPDAEVEVRGTRFKVDVVPAVAACGGGTVTRVAVEEGVVEVRGPSGEVRIRAAGRWPEGCEPLPPTPASASRARVRHPVARSVGRAAVASRSAEAQSSTLATENDLFASALRAERDGDAREAMELLDVLLNRFPRSPLHASAAAARERLISPSRVP